MVLPPPTRWDVGAAVTAGGGRGVAGEPLSFPSPRGARSRAARHVRSRGLWPRSAARGHHASGRGEGFGRLVGLTTLGALVPGTALIAAGRRRTGWAVLALFAAGLAALVGLVLAGDVLSVGLDVATRPDSLLVIAVGVVVIAVLWCAVILVGHWLLRRGRLTRPQQVLSGLVVAALMGLVAVPGATAARYALTQRSLILTVFDEPEDEGREDNLASPDIEAEDPWEGTPRINVLLLGSDAGANREGTRPDTIIVASVDTHTGDTVLFSLPRNLEDVPFPKGTPAAEAWPNGFSCENNQCMINAIWSWAEANPHLFPDAEQPGLAATRAAVGEALGLQIDYYAQVNLQGFIDVVDALGGVEMSVERRIPIGGGTSLSGQENPITGYIEPGTQVLDGYHALWYARSREGSDDYDRMGRQRCVLAAVAEQAEPARLARAFPQLAASAERNVQTDVRMSELGAFVELARRVQGGTIRSLTFTRDVITPESPDFEEIRRLVQEAIKPPPPPAPATAAPSPSATASEEPAPAQPREEPAPEASGEEPEAVDVDAVCG